MQIYFIYIDVKENGKTCPMSFLTRQDTQRKEKKTSNI